LSPSQSPTLALRLNTGLVAFHLQHAPKSCDWPDDEARLNTRRSKDSLRDLQSLASIPRLPSKRRVSFPRLGQLGGMRVFLLHLYSAPSGSQIYSYKIYALTITRHCVLKLIGVHMTISPVLQARRHNRDHPAAAQTSTVQNLASALSGYRIPGFEQTLVCISYECSVSVQRTAGCSCLDSLYLLQFRQGVRRRQSSTRLIIIASLRLLFYQTLRSIHEILVGLK
jgi:hypothetical protein